MSGNSATTESNSQFRGRAERSFRQSLYAMLGLSSVVMMVAIDQTVVGTALPTIVADLKRFDLYEWVATSYLLITVITVPIFGRLGDWFGRKPLIVMAIILFTCASALCGIAGTMQMLIAYRALQGIGGGMLVGTCFASIPDLFPDPVVRLRWQVLFSSAFGLANAVGPSLGGFLSQHYGWRSAFLVNIPVGIVSLYLTARHLPQIQHVRLGRLSPDWRGALLIAVSLGALQLLVEVMGSGGARLHVWVYGLIAVGAGGLLVREERRAENPIIPPALLKNRATVVLLALSMLMGVAMFVLLFYVPLLLQGGAGLSADEAGIMVTPLVACITIGTVTNTRIVTRLRRPNVLLYFGFGLLAIACAGIALAGAAKERGVFVAAMIAAGVGIGFVMPNLTVFVQQVAGRAQLGISTALIQSARMVGGMLGTAVMGTMVRELYKSGLARALTSEMASTPETWIVALRDPQILMSAQSAGRFVVRARSAGVEDGAQLLAAARGALAHAIGTSLLGLAMFMVVAVAIAWLLPVICITSTARSRQATSPSES